MAAGGPAPTEITAFESPPLPSPGGVDVDHLPQQGRMRLVQAIAAAGDRFIRVTGEVTPRWPTAVDGSVHAVMLVEFVAQGAALLGAQLGANDAGTLALLVGLPAVTLHVRRVALGTLLVADVEVERGTGDYLVCRGRVFAGGAGLAEVTVQGIRVPIADTERTQGTNEP